AAVERNGLRRTGTQHDGGGVDAGEAGGGEGQRPAAHDAHQPEPGEGGHAVRVGERGGGAGQRRSTGGDGGGNGGAGREHRIAARVGDGDDRLLREGHAVLRRCGGRGGEQEPGGRAGGYHRGGGVHRHQHAPRHPAEAQGVAADHAE